MGYVDLLEISNPATDGFVPASWGQQLRDNDLWLGRRPHAHAYNAAPQAIATITTTALEFNTERRDNAGIHSIIDGSRDVFYLKEGGWWLLWCSYRPSRTQPASKVASRSPPEFW